jgi:hypothetical protein
MTVLEDPWNGDLTRDAGDGVVEVYCRDAGQWVPACQCGPHVECPEHLGNCAVLDEGAR